VASLTWANRILFGVVLLLQLFFLVNGAALFPAYWQAQHWDVWMPTYFAITIAAVGGSAFLGSGKGYGAIPFGDPFGIFPFVEVGFIGFFFVSFGLFQVPALHVPLAIPVGDATPTALMNFAVISFGEELVFRWFLIGLLFKLLKWGAAPVSAAAWAIFHFAAYGDQPFTILFIFAIGVGLGALYLWTKDTFGVGATWGFHFGWNIGTVGLLAIAFH